MDDIGQSNVSKSITEVKKKRHANSISNSQNKILKPQVPIAILIYSKSLYNCKPEEVFKPGHCLSLRGSEGWDHCGVPYTI